MPNDHAPSPLRSYPVPANEAARSATVDAMALMRHQDDPFFGHVTDMVRRLFGAPIGFVSLFSGDTQTFLTCEGLDLPGTPRTMSLCAYTVAARRTIVLPDATTDPRSADHPVVTEMGLRFSASAPVILSTGFCLGTVCAVDMVAHEPPHPDAIAHLEDLAAMVARYYEVPMEPDPDRAAALRDIAGRAQEEFLSLIGHELRTPLNGIAGLAELIEAEEGVDPEIAEALTESCDHLSRIVSNVLHFTELNSGDIALDEVALDLDERCALVVRTLGPMARLLGKGLEPAGASGLRIVGDAAKLDLALACLVTNAVVHGGAAIRCSVDRLGDGSVEIRVADDGSGIPHEATARIWEAFGIGADVHSRAADGLGLGLPLTRRIIELHGGELDLVTGGRGLDAVMRLPRWRVTGA